MTNPTPHIIHKNIFWLSPERTIFWEEENTLIIADLHLGKTGHFRKEGIPIPQSVYKDDLQRLLSQLYNYKADRLIIVGDLTHSKSNKELDLFVKWRKDFTQLQVDLVMGNHDILQENWYREAHINTHPVKMLHNRFLFVHEKTEETIFEAGYGEDYDYIFSGHVHPGIQIKGQGKQSLVFPCFFFGEHHCVLPAFSKFTGSFLVKPKKNETVFALTGTELVKLA